MFSVAAFTPVNFAAATPTDAAGTSSPPKEEVSPTPIPLPRTVEEGSLPIPIPQPVAIVESLDALDHLELEYALGVTAGALNGQPDDTEHSDDWTEQD